ncbi:MAG: DUF429 domain-containing protein [Pirellulales bacterium]
MLDDGTTVLGIDFTSTPSLKKPITVATGRWYRGSGLAVYQLDEVQRIGSFEEFDAFLHENTSWVGGFDLPFGQPRLLIEHQGWPTQWTDFVHFYCQQSRNELRDIFRQWCDSRPKGNKFAWRNTDKPAGSSPAMRWTNPPVAWMMHAGIERMLNAGLSFPAHHHTGASDQPPRIALEAYPGFTARKITRKSYKSDAVGNQTETRRKERKAIIDALIHGTAKLNARVSMSTSWQNKLLNDGSGDLLDAVICSLQAAHAAGEEHYGLPKALDPLEGWIAAVPSND